MKPAVRVMQIIDSMAFGGAEVLIRGLTCGLLERGYEVMVRYSTPGPIAEEIKAMNIPIARLPRLGRLDPSLLLRMWLEIRREKPDVVHTHLFKSDFHGRIAARLAGVPVVVSTLHNCDRWATNPLLGNIYGITSRLADRLIAVSQEVQDYAIRYGLGSSGRIVTIPNAIPLERFERNPILGEEIRREFHISDSAPLIGIVARLTQQKDHATFLQAAARISEVQPDSRFLIVGEGPLRETLVDQARSLGLSEVVIFCGGRPDMQAIYSSLDVLVFSSRWEGLPVALLEGMAAELPVVATNVGGISGVLRDGEMGRIVPPGEATLLADACLELIADPAKRRQMGQIARAHIYSSYSMDAMVDTTSNLYQSLLSEMGK